MDKKTWLIIGMAIILVVLAVVLVIPKITNAYKMEGMQQGIAVCQQQILNTLVGDLNSRGYTTITVGDKVIRLGIIPTEEQRQALLQQQAMQQ
ncbi:hypothetical protein KY314_02035 [Candidatus Woesearchaeota archaeon]|nr:hypothetical protein [Candidatus Woesearchaeota archaeon]